MERSSLLFADLDHLRSHVATRDRNPEELNHVAESDRASAFVRCLQFSGRFLPAHSERLKQSTAAFRICYFPSSDFMEIAERFTPRFCNARSSALAIN